MEQVNTEFEPTLIEFLDHRDKDNVELIITWTLGKWRVGSKKRGKGGAFELGNTGPAKTGHYRLLEYPSLTSKKPRKEYHVVALEDLVT
jgi:hypothetical protein